MGDWGAKAVAAALLAAAALAACTGRDQATGGVSVAAPAPVPVTELPDPVVPVTSPAPEPPTAVEPPPPPPPVYLPAGVHEHQLDVDGQTRRWTTVVPAVANGSPPSSLVVVLHGVGGRGADMRSAGFEPLAGAQGAVMAYPDALGGAWNDGRTGADPVVPGVAVDDTRFLRMMIEETAARSGADARRVAVVGFSAGAVMASRLACDVADRIAAVAVVAGSAGQGFQQSCRPVRPVAVMMVAASGDSTVPYAGGRVANWGARRRGYVAGVEELFAFWEAQNGCTSTQLVAGPPAVTEARGADCRTGNPVLRFRVNGGGHEWYRMPRFDTTNAVWDFVQRRFSGAA